MAGLCKNGTKEISMIKASFVCKIKKENCQYCKWCYLENRYKMLYPYCEEECDNYEPMTIEIGA
jgi:hypothetical protein